MKILKPHFWYNKSQRNGVFFLVLLILVLQILYSFVDLSDAGNSLPNDQIESLQSQIDSLKKVEIEKRKPKRYSFNPNYITDYKGVQLGMSIEEIDRLLLFRKQNKFINSASQFKKATKISAAEVNAQLLAIGVIVRPIANYEMPTYLRVSIGTPAENKTFITKLKKILSDARS